MSVEVYQIKNLKIALAKQTEITVYEFVSQTEDVIFYKVVWTSQNSYADNLISCWSIDIPTMNKNGPEAWQRVGLEHSVYETPSTKKSIEILTKYL